MDLKQKLFSFKGRINRKPFWLCSIAFSIVIQIIMGILSYLGLAQVAMIFIIPLIWVSIALTVKRLHDLDKNGWMVLLAFVPIANIYLFIITGFFKGTTGKNKYGDDPLGGTNTSTESTKTVEL